MVAAIEPDALVEGISAGVVGSVLFAAIVAGRDWIRVALFKRKLSDSLRQLGCGWAITGLHCSIRNHTGTEFLVRELALVTEKEVMLFNATGEIASSWPEAPRKPTPAEMERLKRGEEVEIGPPTVSHRPLRQSTGTGEFGPVYPFTEHRFVLPLELAAESKGSPVHLRVIIECKDWLGRSMLLREYSNGEMAMSHIATLLRSCRDPEKLAGLNFLREKFGLRAVRIPVVAKTEPAKSAASIQDDPMKQSIP